VSFSKFGNCGDMDQWSRRIHELMDEMHKRSYVGFRGQGTWQPATDVYETPDAYYVCVELAGMNPDDVDIECRNPGQLLVRGTRRNPRPEGVPNPLSVHVMEIDQGPFLREITLPEAIDVDAVEASYDKGYLWIRLPKTAT
jgi:HSP20 family molecular chaperone IbpA